MQAPGEASGSHAYPHPAPPPAGQPHPIDPYARLSFDRARPEQILRTHQRDTSQVQRLVDLVSDLIRAAAGARWLASRQSIIDLAVRIVYLSLTLGRALPTMGEEYTDVVPRAPTSARPTRLRRFATIAFLVLPSLVTQPIVLSRIRESHITDVNDRSPWRERIAQVLVSPILQHLSDLHTVAFLFGGKFLEIGRRITGLRYVSTSRAPRPDTSSYEPLSLLVALPLLLRLAHRIRLAVLHGSVGPSDDGVSDTGLTRPSGNYNVTTPPRGAPLSPDDPITFLDSDALIMPDRQCTLCLEPRGTGAGSAGAVAVTECGHAFCWGCLGGLDKNDPPSTPTPAQRYPARLSRNHRSAGQLRQTGNHNNNNNAAQRNNRTKPRNKRSQQPAPSIDHHSRPIPNRPAPSTNPVIRIKELSSLEELLRQAGYKDTRVCTPEAEKVRQIKKTFEEDEAEELNDLYGTFGLKRQSSTRAALEHRIQNITEPTKPFRSSSAMLRDLALQNAKQSERETLPSSPPAEGSSWWEGGMAAIGRAAKAVIEMSPPPSGPGPAGQPAFGSLPPSALPDSLRKTKSTMELGLHRPLSSSMQEQKPAIPVPVDTTGSHAGMPGITTDFMNERDIVTTSASTAQLAFEDDVYGYHPLPSEYEAQCEDDSVFDHSTSFEVGSLGSSDGRPEPDGNDAEDLEDAHAVDNDLRFFAGETTLEDRSAAIRIMEGAHDYDEDLDSPPRSSLPLPPVEPDEVNEHDAQTQLPAIPSDPPTRYGDRAAKLRIAKSTPQLQTVTARPSWLGSLRQAIMGAPASAEPPLTHTASAGRAHGLRITPTAVAAPSLVTTSTVLCDSASNGAVDLPPVQVRVRQPPTTYESLRLRPSLAKLRQAVFPAPAVSEDATPTLSPRLDWDDQGEQYAGWGWSTKKQRPPIKPTRTPNSAEPDIADQARPNGSIDYSRSFFYKPGTPPRKVSGPSVSRPAAERSSTEPHLRTRRSEKSLRAALLLPVAPPPVPAIPSRYSRLASSSAATPPRRNSLSRLEPPVLAIQSPGSWEAGLPPRTLVLEGEEWDARDGNVPGDWGRRAVRKSGSKKLRKPDPVC